MTIQIADPVTGIKRLTVTGISAAQLTNDNAIVNLAAGLREDFSAILGSTHEAKKSIDR
jgi:hypothetical protein